MDGFGREALAAAKAETLTLELEAKDDLSAACFVGEKPKSIEGKYNLSLEITRLKGHIDCAISKVDAFAQEQNDQFTRLTAKKQTLFPDEDVQIILPAEIVDLMNHVGAGKATAAGHYAVLKQQLDTLKGEAQKATNSEQIKICRTTLAGLSKLVNSGEGKAFGGMLKFFSKHLDEFDKQKDRDSTPRVGHVLAPLHTIVGAMDMSKFATSVGTSIFEAKAGIKPAVCAVNVGQDVVGPLFANQLAKKAFRELEVFLKGATDWGVWPIRQPPQLKKVQNHLKKCIDNALLTKIVLPDAAWAKDIFQPQFIGYKAPSLHVGWAPFGLMEAITCFRGGGRLLGITTTKIPGTTYQDKRRFLFASTVDTLTEIASEAGFLMEVVEGKTYVVPSGFARVFVSTGGMMGLRWSIASDEADMGRVKQTVREMLSAFVELKQPSTSYVQFLDFIESE